MPPTDSETAYHRVNNTIGQPSIENIPRIFEEILNCAIGIIKGQGKAGSVKNLK